MIVPRTRLLIWFALIVPTFALVQAAEPATTPVALAVVSGFFLFTIADAVSARSTLKGIDVQLAPVTRMSKDRAAQVELRIRNERQRARVIRLALPFPPEIPPHAPEVDVSLPAGSEWSRVDWTCTPTRRGSYRLNAAYIEAASPFGFWAVRRARPVDAELRVYPNLARERRNLAALFLNRGMFGIHAQRQVGQGREFEKLREYTHGDGFDQIHWKATARRGKPVTKVFQIERTQEVYVVIDASRLSARLSGKAVERSTNVDPHPCPLPPAATARQRGESDGRGWPPGRVRVPFDDASPPTALERFVSAALVLGLAAEKQGDLFGLITFSDQVGTFLRARNGTSHYSTCRDALYTLQPKIVSPDFDELCTFIRLRLRRRALLVFLTALDDPALAESFVQKIELVRRQHLVLVNMLQPEGAVPLFSNPDVQNIDELYRDLGGHLQWRKLRELGKVLQRRGVRFSLLPDERLGIELVSQYLGVKQRQLI